MRFEHKGGHTQVRFDRILSRSNVWQPEQVQRLGMKPIATDLPKVFPSDHFGLFGAYTY